jgi:hypothetical protein
MKELSKEEIDKDKEIERLKKVVGQILDVAKRQAACKSCIKEIGQFELNTECSPYSGTIDTDSGDTISGVE